MATDEARSNSEGSRDVGVPVWSVSLLSAGAGAVLGFGLQPGHNPEISAGAAIVIALAIFVMALRPVLRDGFKTARITAAEASRSAFFEHAIEGIFRTTIDGRYLDANPALARIYGYERPDELISGLTDIAGQLYVDPSRREAFRKLMDKNDAVVDFVSEIRRRDGSKIWISENARAVRNWTGESVFYEGTVEDVTAKIEADEAMRRALRETEEASRAKTAFLAAMSHELKTPLNAVLGFSEIMRKEILGPLGNTTYQGYADDIHASGAHLLAIINDILDITRAQADAITLAREPVSVTEIARRSLGAVRLATNDARDVAVDIPDRLPDIFVDPQRLSQALVKLLSNALKFTPEGGRIALSARATDDRGISISVIDEGIGMAPEMIAQVLEPFAQGDQTLARRFEGAGLGLAIARALIELHGGRLSLESTERSGTTATVFLPEEVVVLETPERRVAG